MTVYDLLYLAVDDCIEIYLYDFHTQKNIFKGSIDEFHELENYDELEQLEVWSWEVSRDCFGINIDTSEL